MSLRTTALHSSHLQLGAKMVPFGGWDMPVSYPSGTIVEHMACRESAVMFDVSHLGTVRVEGPDAFARLQDVLTNDLAKISVGHRRHHRVVDR
jgi:aminomethyltransferase